MTLSFIQTDIDRLIQTKLTQAQKEFSPDEISQIIDQAIQELRHKLSENVNIEAFRPLIINRIRLHYANLLMGSVSPTNIRETMTRNITNLGIGLETSDSRSVNAPLAKLALYRAEIRDLLSLDEIDNPDQTINTKDVIEVANANYESRNFGGYFSRTNREDQMKIYVLETLILQGLNADQIIQQFHDKGISLSSSDYHALLRRIFNVKTKPALPQYLQYANDKTFTSKSQSRHTEAFQARLNEIRAEIQRKMQAMIDLRIGKRTANTPTEALLFPKQEIDTIIYNFVFKDSYPKKLSDFEKWEIPEPENIFDSIREDISGGEHRQRFTDTFIVRKMFQAVLERVLELAPEPINSPESQKKVKETLNGIIKKFNVLKGRKLKNNEGLGDEIQIAPQNLTLTNAPFYLAILFTHQYLHTITDISAYSESKIIKSVMDQIQNMGYKISTDNCQLAVQQAIVEQVLANNGTVADVQQAYRNLGINHKHVNTTINERIGRVIGVSVNIIPQLLLLNPLKIGLRTELL
jgi:hypothetical protein